jgi:serine/threonine protein kinase
MPLSSAAPEDKSPYTPGYVISGKYELELVLGEGGMGSVWRARNTALDSAVAIKLIRGDLNRETLGTRLLQEARAAAKLGHPAIVRVFDVGQTEYLDPFIVMELLRGESFGSLLLATNRMPATRALQLLLPIADALSVAHGKRIVHRDLKPDNVFIANNEGQIQPKLVDFGIAKLERRDDGSQMTQAGVVLGSPDYMSPEQARGQDDIDLRTDIWSFCVMLYEALTGELPFNGANYNALLRSIVESTPPTAQALGAADAALSAIIERGMSKDRADRWASMAELGKAMAHWLMDQGITEDVCGVSLESKWLGRSTDPSSRRVSRTSIPDFERTPHSGLRTAAIPATTSTMPPPPDTGRPVSTPVAAPRAQHRRARLVVYAALGAVALLVTLAVALTKKTTATSHDAALPTAFSLGAESPAERALPSPEPSKPLPSATTQGPAETTGAASSSARALGASTPTKAARPHPAPGSGRPAADPKKPGGTKPEPGSDLLAPY